jgi:hypothetical protein
MAGSDIASAACSSAKAARSFAAAKASYRVRFAGRVAFGTVSLVRIAIWSVDKVLDRA